MVLPCSLAASLKTPTGRFLYARPYHPGNLMALVCRYPVTPLRRYAFAPLPRYAVTPLCRYAVTPLPRYAVTPLRLCAVN